ncbi:hypothetical protein [Mycoplana sp. MJR14]|nr:hypothetical protein [Mycoplana sp. MJR14]MDF1631912.1 hypothetical protein [Mycoplana sp. MJR14]
MTKAEIPGRGDPGRFIRGAHETMRKEGKSRRRRIVPALPAGAKLM